MTRRIARTLVPPPRRKRATKETIILAEAALGFQLPKALQALLLISNGGVPTHGCFPTLEPNSWAPDHIRVTAVLGVGYPEGMDGALGSAYLVREWGYPEIGVVLCITPSAGEDVIMLDYRACGNRGEPSVVFVEHDRKIVPLAPSFSKFWTQLKQCKS